MTEYSDAGTCPKCGSDDIDYNGSEIEDQTLYYECNCNKCETHFHECYDILYAGKTWEKQAIWV